MSHARSLLLAATAGTGDPSIHSSSRRRLLLRTHIIHRPQGVSVALALVVGAWADPTVARAPRALTLGLPNLHPQIFELVANAVCSAEVALYARLLAIDELIEDPLIRWLTVRRRRRRGTGRPRPALAARSLVVGIVSRATSWRRWPIAISIATAIATTIATAIATIAAAAAVAARRVIVASVVVAGRRATVVASIVVPIIARAIIAPAIVIVVAPWWRVVVPVTPRWWAPIAIIVPITP